ncbi:hypothetical protein C1H76_0160 [Elsinoe australis]|uniref:Uncharacterized protein n=1 Tax=Elsinoe australis TaxID=40998 RepID=A0A4U7B774_9PEZI|nr:hypothetical protein C1H76_0160 [Elsinoe australis]
MGSGSSKTQAHHDENVRSVRKQIGKRSSVNFLQRLDTRPLHTHQASPSLPPRISELSERVIHPLPQPLSSHPPALSPSSSTTIKTPTTRTLAAFQDPSPDEDLPSLHSNSSSSFDKDPAAPVASVPGEPSSPSAKSLPSVEQSSPSSGKHSTETASLPVTTPQLSSDDSNDSAQQDLDNADDGSDPETPLAPPPPISSAPMLRVPTPLAQDSPIRYGLEEAMETVRVAVTREIQKKRATTGPELFRQALELQIATNFTNHPPQPKSPPRRNTISEYPSRSIRIYRPRIKYSPAELFRRTLAKQHMLPPPRGKDPSPRTVRLLRRPYPFNLVRDDPAHGSANIRYALAPPISASQRSCHTHHPKWYEASNLMHPVECAICLYAGDCESDTKVAWMCGFCALRICAECRSVFDEKGMKGLMKRERDGGRTVEARRGRAGGRKSTVG